MGTVVVVGSLNQDLVMHLPRHPRTGETLLAQDVVRRYGGKGANQAVAAARAGAVCELVGRVGDDPVGRQYLERLAGLSVGTSALALTPGAVTGTAVIYVDGTGDNMIVVAPGANARVTVDDLSRLDGLGPDDVLLLQMELPTDVVVDAVRRSAARGARVVLNLSPVAPLPEDVLAVCDPLVVNEHEAAALSQTGPAPPSVLVTLGPEGSRWGEVVVGAEQVTAVDTTGAGDAYCGTLAARLCLGDDRAGAMRAASAAAALTVQHVGAQPDPAT